MRTVRVVNTTRGFELARSAGVADGWWTRLRGLLGRPELEEGEGLLIRPCRGVHMYGMSYPIDVALIDRSGEVVAVYRELAPNTRSGWHGEAACALELPAGTLARTGTVVGDRVEWSEESGNGGPPADGGPDEPRSEGAPA